MHSGGIVHRHEPVAQPESEPEPHGISGGGLDYKMPIYVPSFFKKTNICVQPIMFSGMNSLYYNGEGLTP